MQPIADTNIIGVAKPTLNSYPMVIMSKNRIFKPKVLVNDLFLEEPSCFVEALQNGNWKATMIEENEIFVKNKT